MNALLTHAGELLIGPFAAWPLVGLIVYGILSGVAATYVFGKTSPQMALQRVADQSRAHLLAIRLGPYGGDCDHQYELSATTTD